MDIFQLQCFVTIVNKKSFTEAAYEVSISQSALSKHISKLEDELRIQLFDRSRRSAVLTPMGQEFEPYARKLLADYEEMLSAVRQFSANDHLLIGTIDHMGRVGVTAPISSFLKKYPGDSISIEMEKGNTIELMNQLTAKKIHMAFIAHIISSPSGTSNIDSYNLAPYHLYTLVRDEYHVVVGRDHPFTRLDRKLSWKDLAAEKLVILDKSYSLNAIIRESFCQNGLHPSIAFECDQVDTILGMVEEGFGISILSKRIAAERYHVSCLPMEVPILRNTTLVVPRDIEKNHRLAGTFVRHILDFYADFPPET